MRSPAELRAKLRRQWQNRVLREARLLRADQAWPITIAIGQPSSKRILTDFDAVKRHLEQWRRESVGEVVWNSVRYRATDDRVEVPVSWKLRKPSEWVDACQDRTIRAEYQMLAELVEQSNSVFHSLFVGRRSIWQGKPIAEVAQAARVAMALEPRVASGRPLRALSLEGIDTKFFERNERLITALLDARFDGEVSKMGIAAFLGALADGDHWLLVMDLDGSLLPFRKQRVRSSELLEKPLPGTKLLIVENESCQHLLPFVADTVAVLGTGFDLDWLANSASTSKHVGYWGDIDTWGMQFLAKAKNIVRNLFTLMMSNNVYDRFIGHAVPEPIVAGIEPPAALSTDEKALYERLLKEGRGRLEQEFLPKEIVGEAIFCWAKIDAPHDPFFRA